MVHYENLAKNKPAWGLGLSQEDTYVITDGNDNKSSLIKGTSGAGWAFLGVDLETPVDIGYIRVLMSVCECTAVSFHQCDVMMSAMASQITGVSIVCSIACSGADQSKHQSSASLAFVGGIHWWPVDSPHKGPLTCNTFPFDDVTMVDPL